MIAAAKRPRLRPALAVWRVLAAVADGVTDPATDLAAFRRAVRAGSRGRCRVAVTTARVPGRPVAGAAHPMGPWPDWPDAAAWLAANGIDAEPFDSVMVLTTPPRGQGAMGLTRTVRPGGGGYSACFLRPRSDRIAGLLTHEWLHQAAEFYGSRGHALPDVHGAREHGYAAQEDYFAALLAGRLPGPLPGFTAAVWAEGAPRSGRVG